MICLSPETDRRTPYCYIDCGLTLCLGVCFCSRNSHLFSMDTELSDLELVAAVEQMESNLWCTGDDELTDMELLRFVEMMEESFAADKGR